MPERACSQRRGFTMIEIMIVVVVLGVLAAIAVPRMISRRELAIFSEGVGIIKMITAAEFRYGIDHETIEMSCADLDIKVETSNFLVECAFQDSEGKIVFAELTRQGGPAYEIRFVWGDGFSCTGECPPGHEGLYGGI